MDTTGTDRGAQLPQGHGEDARADLTPAEQRALRRKLKVRRAKAKRPKSQQQLRSAE